MTWQRLKSNWKTVLSLAAVLACSTLLCLRWVYRVPIFQSPDEPTHFNYALCINEHRGLLKAPKDPEDGVTHPYVHLLLEEASTMTMVHTATRVPLDYGTDGYYREIDRAAPARDTYQITQGPVISATYPFGFYGVLALWLEGVRLVNGNGPVGLLFGARLFSVLLLQISLCLTYGIARLLNTPSRIALLLTACIGCFPMVTFISSYVQPDNLAFTLVSLCFFLALLYKRRPESYSILAGLGLALGMLLVTKQHFYVCVMLSVTGLLATRWLIRPSMTRAAFVRLILLAAPSMLLWMVHHQVTKSSTNVFSPAATYTSRYEHYVLGFVRAFNDYYLGQTHVTFWGVFGWADTALVIGSSEWTEKVRLACQCAAFILIALTLLRLEQLASRLLRLARRGRARMALRLLCSNVPVNAYFIFTILMFVLYIYTDNRFSAQGRNWLPLMLPIFWTSARYAPRALSAPAARALVSCSVVLGLAYFAAAGSWYALKTIKQRYYYSPQQVSLAKQHPALIHCALPATEILCQPPRSDEHKLSYICAGESIEGLEILSTSTRSDTPDSLAVAVFDDEGVLLRSSESNEGELYSTANRKLTFEPIQTERGQLLHIRLSFAHGEPGNEKDEMHVRTPLAETGGLQARLLMQAPSVCLTHCRNKQPLVDFPRIGHRKPISLEHDQSQSFECPFEVVEGIEVYFCKEKEQVEGTVTVSILNDNGEELASSTIEARCIASDAYQWFPIGTLRGMRGRHLNLRLKADCPASLAGNIKFLTDHENDAAWWVFVNGAQ